MRFRTCAGVLLCVAALASCGSSENSVSQSTSNNASQTTSDPNLSSDTSPQEVTTTTSAHVVETAKLKIESGFSSEVDDYGSRSTWAGAVLTNPRKTQAACDVSVTFNVKDGSGAVLDTDTANVAWVPAGGRVLVAPLSLGYDVKAVPTQLGVTAIVTNYATVSKLSECPDTYSFYKGVPLQVVSAAIQRDEYSSSIKGQVKNQTSQVVKDASLDCVYRAAGKIVGGESTSVSDPMPPGGTVAFEAGFGVPKSADAVECQVIA